MDKHTKSMENFISKYAQSSKTFNQLWKWESLGLPLERAGMCWVGVWQCHGSVFQRWLANSLLHPIWSTLPWWQWQAITWHEIDLSFNCRNTLILCLLITLDLNTDGKLSKNNYYTDTSVNSSTNKTQACYNHLIPRSTQGPFHKTETPLLWHLICYFFGTRNTIFLNF